MPSACPRQHLTAAALEPTHPPALVLESPAPQLAGTIAQLPSMQIPTYAYALCALGLYWAVKRIVDRRKAQRLPPGPPSLAPYAAKAGPKPFQWVIFDAVKDDYGERKL